MLRLCAQALTALAVVTTLLPPHGCRIETVVVRHDADVKPTLTIQLVSLCPAPSDHQIRCTQEWTETAEGRQGVSVSCDKLDPPVGPW